MSPEPAPPDVDALRAELTAVLVALGRATTTTEAAALVARRNLLGRQIARRQAEIAGSDAGITEHNRTLVLE